MRSLFGGRRRSIFKQGKELGHYRNTLFAITQAIDARLAQVADDIGALRRRAMEPEEAVVRLSAHEQALDAGAKQLEGMLAPEELHGLHMEYEANLERALRGIVMVERGCAITRLAHRPPDDDEPLTYYKRGHGNVNHARLRMAEIVEVLLSWQPGRPAEASIAARLHRDDE